MNYGRKKLSKSKHQQQARRTLKNGEKKGSRRKEMWIQSLRSTYFIGKKRIQWSKALCIPKPYAASLYNGEQKQALQAWKVHVTWLSRQHLGRVLHWHGCLASTLGETHCTANPASPSGGKPVALSRHCDGRVPLLTPTWPMSPLAGAIHPSLLLCRHWQWRVEPCRQWQWRFPPKNRPPPSLVLKQTLIRK